MVKIRKRKRRKNLGNTLFASEKGEVLQSLLPHLNLKGK
jgi:hypothetical protein